MTFSMQEIFVNNHCIYEFTKYRFGESITEKKELKAVRTLLRTEWKEGWYQDLASLINPIYVSPSVSLLVLWMYILCLHFISFLLFAINAQRVVTNSLLRLHQAIDGSDFQLRKISFSRHVWALTLIAFRISWSKSLAFV